MVAYTFDPDLVSDLHKDTYGFRPTMQFWIRWNNSADDEKQGIWDDLVAAHQREVDEYYAARDRAIKEFSELIEKTKALMPGASTAKVIDILMEPYMGDEGYIYYGSEHVEMELGLPPGHINKLKVAA